MFYAALAAGVAATVLFLAVRVKKGGIPGLITKTLASVFFILTAVFACFAAGNFDVVRQYGLFIVAGLIFGMLGDIWLDLKWVYPEDNDVYTFAGMISFALGHVFYLYAIYSFSAAVSASVWYIIVPLAAAVIFGGIAIGLEKVMKLEYGKFKWISFAYGAILAFMTFSAASAMIATGFETVWIVMTVGGVFFIISDLILSGMYFDIGKSKNTPVNIVLNHATYYIAQFVIAASIMFAV